jgi:hypothetical protein
MTTKAQIARLAARIDDLARRSDTRPEVALVWQDLDETTDQALARYYEERPEARRAKQIYILSWLGAGDGVRE